MRCERNGEGAAKQLTKREAISKSEITQEYCILSGKKGKNGNEEKWKLGEKKQTEKQKIEEIVQVISSCCCYCI